MPNQHTARPHSPAERFWEKVDKQGDCWLWTSSLDKGGYGQFWLGERCVEAYKFSYESRHGPVPVGLELDHLCQTPACVNPAHLQAVTHQVNMQRHYRYRALLEVPDGK